jgi:BASS family bile acid:Na+ symporter
LFPAWVVSAALLGLLQPQLLSWFQGPLIEAALGATMVCMGSTLSLQDFRGVAPINLLLGFLAQFSIMPAMACASAKIFGLPPAFAAGLILVGCCPGGTASNLVTLIAGADVALSVAMTACSTAAAAIMTVGVTIYTLLTAPPFFLRHRRPVTTVYATHHCCARLAALSRSYFSL